MSELTIPWVGWELREQLGSGGFGTVYRIENPGTGEQSAMKVLSLPKDVSEINALRLEGYDNPSIAGIYQNQLNRIINEYSLMAQMKGHANIVRSEDCTAVPHANGLGWDVYIRMELLNPLTRYLMSHSLDESEVIRLGTDLCCALVLCEQKNIIHRDIKPENIFLSEYGVYKLGDFGIARTMDHTTMATHAGSYRYMAPEVYKNERYGKEVDIYSLGLTLYWLLNNRRMPFLPTDRPPRASENEQALQMRLSGTPVPPPVNGSEALKAVVVKACAYDPRDRYRTAEELLRALEAVRDGVAPGYGYGSANPAGARQTADNVWHDSSETVGRPRKAARAGRASSNTAKTVGETGTSRGASNPRQEAQAQPRPAAAAPKPAAGWTVIYLVLMAAAQIVMYILYFNTHKRLTGLSDWSTLVFAALFVVGLIFVFLGKPKKVANISSWVLGALTFFAFLSFSDAIGVWHLWMELWGGWSTVVFFAGIPAAILTVIACGANVNARGNGQ